MNRPCFKNRADAGQRLAKLLEPYLSPKTVIYGLPRGGVIVAAEAAKHLKAPLELAITRKIGHPLHPEYAIGAVAEDGTFVGQGTELKTVDRDWLEREIERQTEEIKRRKELYQGSRPAIPATGKTAILTDDGIATGLTIMAAARMLRKQKPLRLVIAVPVMPASAAEALKAEADDVVAIFVDPDYLGAVGEYYDDFDQTSDAEVARALDR
ncbi:MAG: phosphoribosyltransferase family protein [Minisyncoccia bacterium]|jgi:predicted phosphoribosyltransferase